MFQFNLVLSILTPPISLLFPLFKYLTHLPSPVPLNASNACMYNSLSYTSIYRFFFMLYTLCSCILPYRFDLIFSSFISYRQNGSYVNVNNDSVLQHYNSIERLILWTLSIILFLFKATFGILDPVSFLKEKKPTQLLPIDRASPYL
jgi:cytochrome b subunit of formate dehydrogenase